MDLLFHQISSDNSLSTSDEISSDVATQSPESSHQDFVSPQPSYHLSMNEHLNHISTEITQESSSLSSDIFSDDDFCLDQMNKPFIPTKQPYIEPVSSVIVVIAHPQDYSKADSNFAKTRPSFISWKTLKSNSSADFLGSLTTSYKNEYTRLLPIIRFIPFVSPSIDKMNTLPTIRRESGYGRGVFHYIGYGFSPISKASLNLSDGRPDNIRPFSLKKLFESFYPPSWFIFDCDSAESALDGLIKASNDSLNYDSSNKTDWFCLCATSKGEELPIDPCLPRDFLTTCLFTPISLSILCHVLQYYRTSFLSSDFPLSHIEELLLASNDIQLDTTLSTITDAIAAGFMKPDLYHLLFYQDSFISSFYKNFILSQYLLSPYEVHPVSYPAIPSTISHPLWHQWQATLDLWVMSTTSPRPSFATDFFNRSIITFSTFLVNKKTKIDVSLLTILARYPTTQLTGCDRAITLLAEYSAMDLKNREKIASVIKFNDLFEKLIARESSDEEYQSLAYLILALLQLDLNFACQIHSELNMAILPSFIFDESINETTRSLLSAIFAAVVIFNRTLRQICASSEFINAAKDAIQTAHSPQLILWLLILLKRSFSILSADFSCFYNSSSHIQISVCLFHKIPEVRAAATSALSCFMQSDECALNLHLILFAINLYKDASFLVRHQLLLLLSRFLSSSRNPSSTFANGSTLKKYNFTSLLENWLQSSPKTFSEYAMAVDKIAHLEDSTNYIVGIVHYLIEYFTHDPHPAIHSLACRNKGYFYEDNKSSASNSISPPFTSLKLTESSFEEDEDETKEISTFESDSDALYNIAVKHLVKSAQWKVTQEDEVYQYKRSCKDVVFGNINLPTIHLQPRAASNGIEAVKITFDPKTLQTAVATKNCHICTLDEDMKVSNSIKISDTTSISDLCCDMIARETIIAAGTSDGCCFLWYPQCNNVYASWRADINYVNDSIPLFARISSHKSTIATARGTDGLALWAAKSMQLIGEWPCDDEAKQITAFTIHPGNQNICVLGFDNGGFTAIDTRTPCNEKILTVSIGERIVGLSGNRVGADLIYTATSSGRCLVWDMSTNNLTPCGSQKMEIDSFDAHFALPILGFSSKEESPIIMAADGNCKYKANEVSPNSILAFHPILPVVTFGSPDGQILSYNILLNNPDA
ncbi:hypothetical protein TRFO_04093 [Tritrichomonas foetus]|uniref:Raptor N-terminal CASPase-like domain-containing protein n=1 Tax=Tritrichomonas foetus TaxID=1144522 RepID=A0A1J4KJ70_9EUKA|nr:hypothetical protein TRFO_04093 [Tritrichomonas foetus]|eukprot:OHT11130.1 hypothetical protein TRFO_04093 [Tritrichomonas foetus]